MTFSDTFNGDADGICTIFGLSLIRGGDRVVRISSICRCGKLAYRTVAEEDGKQSICHFGGNGDGCLIAPLPGHPPGLFQALIHLPNATKIIISVTLIAPMTVYMGMPFPVGMMRLAYAAQDTIPWAWAINGCASVVGAALATLLAIHLGFSMVVLDLRFNLCCLAGV